MGQGKSTLLREFGRMARNFNEAEKKASSGKRLSLAKVDFDDEGLKRSPACFYSIWLQLGQVTGPPFLTFNAPSSAATRKTGRASMSPRSPPSCFRGRASLTDLLGLLGDSRTMAVNLGSIALPSAGLIYKLGSRPTGRLKTRWSTRGNKVLARIERRKSIVGRQEYTFRSG